MSTPEPTTTTSPSRALPASPPCRLRAGPSLRARPRLNDQGYYVGLVERNLYWVTDGTYQAAFLTTPDGVVLFGDAPTIGHNLQRAIDETAAANGTSNTVTHLVYSHHHADHAGAASLFDTDVVRIGHEETRRLLLRDDDPARPAPTETFQDRRSLDIGGERIELAWHGSTTRPTTSTSTCRTTKRSCWSTSSTQGGHRSTSPTSPKTSRLPPGPRHRPVLPLEALHRRPPGQARHPRRRQAAPAVHGRHRRQRQDIASHR